MSKISPINDNFFTKMPNQPIQTQAQPTPPDDNDNFKIIDLSKEYSQNELKEILGKVGARVDNTWPCRYSAEYYETEGGKAFVINNESCTNDTTEIYENGRVINCGSWHNKELAPAGSFPEIVEDAKARAEKIKNQ